MLLNLNKHGARAPFPREEREEGALAPWHANQENP